MVSRFAPWALALAFMALWLPTLNSTRLQEVDELTHARAALEAARDGHWAPLTLGGRPWTEKPPLLPWLAALSARAGGDLLASWPYRFWPCLAAALCLAALYQTAFLAAGPAAGWLAALLFGLQGDLIFHARFFTMDTAVLACALWAFLLPGKAAFALLFAAAWIKGWFVLAYVPALAFAYWRQDRLGELKGALWGAALGLLSWLAFYTALHGPWFLMEEWSVNLWGRVQGLTNERIENNLSYYGKWSLRTAASLLPLLALAPAALMLQPRARGLPALAADFAAALALSWFLALCLIRAQVINYLLPLEAALCLAWALALRGESSLARDAVLALGAAAMLASSRRILGVEAALLISCALALAYFLLRREASPPHPRLKGLIYGLNGLTLAFLTFSAFNYLRRPDNPSGQLADLLISKPARSPGETLYVIGQNTQAIAFYSRYNGVPLQAVPEKRPAEAVLANTKNGWVFYPPLK